MSLFELHQSRVPSLREFIENLFPNASIEIRTHLLDTMSNWSVRDTNTYNWWVGARIGRMIILQLWLGASSQTAVDKYIKLLRDWRFYLFFVITQLFRNCHYHAAEICTLFPPMLRINVNSYKEHKLVIDAIIEADKIAHALADTDAPAQCALRYGIREWRMQQLLALNAQMEIVMKAVGNAINTAVGE